MLDSNSINTRPHSTTGGKKIKSATIDRREEITATRTTVNDRRCHNKLSNNSPREIGRSTFNRVTDSKNNDRIYSPVTNKKDNTKLHRGNSGSNRTDRTNVVVSQLAPEKITENETSRMTGVSAPRADVGKEKERKFSSRLPIRKWKRLRTKEPARRPKNDATNGDVNREGMEIETARSSERVENDDVRAKDRAAANRNDVKRSDRFKAGSLGADKLGSRC